MNSIYQRQEPSKLVEITTKETVRVVLETDLLPVKWDDILALPEKTPEYYISNVAIYGGQCRVVVTLTRGTNIVEGFTRPSFKAVEEFLPGIEIVKE